MGGNPVVGYCDGCVKVKDALCTLFENPAAKTRALGCAFSPVELKKQAERGKIEKEEARRLGQPKTKKGKK